MKIYCLYLVYGDKHIDSGIIELQKLIKRLFDANSFTFIIINNAQRDNNEIAINCNTIIISGDNKSREFSGWNKGFAFLNERFEPRSNDCIIVANDTFHRNYGNSYLEMFQKKRLQKTMMKNGLAGYQDSYPREINIFGLKIKSWLRTSLLIGPYQAFEKLLPFEVPHMPDEIFADDPLLFFKNDVNLDHQYRFYIKGWLTNNYDGCGNFKEAWHSHAVSNSENLKKLQEKAYCILNEHYLNARAKKMGMCIYAVNEVGLLTRLKRKLFFKIITILAFDCLSQK